MFKDKLETVHGGLLLLSANSKWCLSSSIISDMLLGVFW